MKPYYDEAGIQIYHGDCREIAPLLGYDAIVTDPPYGTGGWRRPRTGMGKSTRGADLIREEWDSGSLDWLGAATVACVFWTPARTRKLLERADCVGLRKHRTLYWHKPDPMPRPGGRTLFSVEPIWCLSLEGFLLSGGDDVYTASTPRAGRDTDATGHPYQKPLTLLRWLIQKLPSDLSICDPFVGSGTTLRAAKDLGRRAIGIDIEERYCEMAAKRLGQAVMFGAEVTA